MEVATDVQIVIFFVLCLSSYFNYKLTCVSLCCRAVLSPTLHERYFRKIASATFSLNISGGIWAQIGYSPCVIQLLNTFFSFSWVIWCHSTNKKFVSKQTPTSQFSVSGMSNSATDLQWLRALPRTKFSFYNGPLRHSLSNSLDSVYWCKIHWKLRKEVVPSNSFIF